MKKYLVFLIVLAIIMLSAGCGNSAASDEKTISEDTEKTDHKTDNEDDIKKDKDLPLTYFSYDANVDIDVPNVQTIENRLTEIYVTEDETMATFTAVNVDTSDDEKVLDAAVKKFQDGIEALLRTSSYEVKESDIQSVNGFKMTRFEGIVHCKSDVKDFDLPIYGYTFYSEGSACGVIGIAGSYEVREPTDDSIEYIKELIDKMIKTVRVH